ncbi:MAG: DNA photolyase, partial [Burkholderiales bacterium]|nr:DNA photolyase [Burkholderiales bacterium]
RHGCLTLEQVRRYALSVAKPSQAYKLIFELAWRDFWRRLWYQLGESALHHAIESAKVPLGTHGLPQDIQQGQTGLACMDAFVAELKATGYVHNHARMWFAAYCVHTRKVDWHAAADWYWCHLLDGDLASNHLSWQWVASTFSHKAYFFNRENLERYTDGEYCQRCQAVCPFDASYETLAQRWFTP